MLESKSRKAKNIGSSFEGEVSDEERQQAQAIDDGPSICASKPFEEPDNRVTVNSVA